MTITDVTRHFFMRPVRRAIALSALGVMITGCVSLGTNPGSPPLHRALPGQVAAGPSAPQAVTPTEPRLPNIVLITTDD